MKCSVHVRNIKLPEKCSNHSLYVPLITDNAGHQHNYTNNFITKVYVTYLISYFFLFPKPPEFSNTYLSNNDHTKIFAYKILIINRKIVE